MREIRDTYCMTIGTIIIAAMVVLVTLGEQEGQSQTSSTYYVSSATGNDGYNGSADYPFKTIQKAIQVANSNDVTHIDTIIIISGVYVERLNINHVNCTIRAAKGASVTIQPVEVMSYDVLIFGYGIEFRDITFNFRGENGNRAGSNNTTGIIAYVRSTFTNCEIIGANGGNAIIIASRRVTVSNCVISGNFTGVKILDAAYENVNIIKNYFAPSLSTYINYEESGSFETPPNASANYFPGAFAGVTPTAVANKIINNHLIDFTPIILTGEDMAPFAVGFQPDMSQLLVHSLGMQTGPNCRLQEAIDLFQN